MHRVWDWPLFLTILAIGSLSLLTIFSINRALAFNQLIFWIIGLLILYFISAIDYRLWQKFSYLLYAVALISLAILLIFGEPVRGSVRWLNFGMLRFQPSEIAKIATILTLASFFNERSGKELKNFLMSTLIATPLIFLVLIQPDIGNTLAFFAVWFTVLLLSSFSLKHFASLIIFLAIIGFFSYELLVPYQKARILSFLNPSQDPLGTGYSLIQSKIAVGSGQFLGRGLGRGSQSQLKFLPEAESDFIFASTAEQLGFIGASLLLFLFSYLSKRLLSIASITDRFGKLIIGGTISYLILQIFVNVGMNMGLVPVTGITFPLVSYGGSSLISTLVILGIIFSISKNTRQFE